MGNFYDNLQFLQPDHMIPHQSIVKFQIYQIFCREFFEAALWFGMKDADKKSLSK